MQKEKEREAEEKKEWSEKKEIYRDNLKETIRCGNETWKRNKEGGS